MALGWFSEAVYDTRVVAFPPGTKLLLFTDGLTDSIAPPEPEQRLHDALMATGDATLKDVTSLIDPAYNEDDITVLLITRLEMPESMTVGVS